MKSTIQCLLKEALIQLQKLPPLPQQFLAREIKVERPKDPAHGDYSSNIAFVLAKSYQQSAQEIAQSIIAVLPSHALIARVEFAPPGFINFFLQEIALSAVITSVLRGWDFFGHSQLNSDQKAQLQMFACNAHIFSMNNIQYAHARICTVFKQLSENGLDWDENLGLAHVRRLISSHEKTLMTLLSSYPDVIMHAAKKHEPQQIAHYLGVLANSVHSYYNAIYLICNNEGLRSARMCLLSAVRCVLKNGLTIMGVSAPESM